MIYQAASLAKELLVDEGCYGGGMVNFLWVTATGRLSIPWWMTPQPWKCGQYWLDLSGLKDIKILKHDTDLRKRGLGWVLGIIGRGELEYNQDTSNACVKFQSANGKYCLQCFCISTWTCFFYDRRSSALFIFITMMPLDTLSFYFFDLLSPCSNS